MTLSIPHKLHQVGIPALIALLSVCLSSPASAFGKKPARPMPPVSADATWKGVEQNPENPTEFVFTRDFPDKRWWATFHQDEHLKNYIEQAIAANPQITLAEARIAESRALARGVLAQEFPSLSLGPSFSRTRVSAAQFAAFGGGVGNITIRPYNIFTMPLDVTYEADLLGKNWNRYQSSKKLAEASLQDYRTAVITLMADVTTAYFNLMAQDKLISLQKEYIRVSQADLDANRLQEREGLISEEQVVIKESILANARAGLQEYYRAQGIARHQLAVLLGRPPEIAGDLPRGDLDQFTLPKTLDTGIPSTLIARRPDILSAESQLESARIDVTVARKDFLPSFTFTGYFGFAATTLGDWLKWNSRTWNVTPKITQGLFQGGAKVSALNVNKARYAQLMSQYRQTVLTAFREVDDALVSLQSHQNAYNDYLAANAALGRELEYQRLRMQAGGIAQSELYPTQAEIVQSQVGLINARLLTLVDALSLYKALGGGY